MTTSESQSMLRVLIESLSMLAADTAVQVAWLNECGWPSDELAEDYWVPAQNAWWMCEEGLISADVRELTEQINTIFTEMSGAQNAARWMDAALTTDAGWIEVRAIAQQALGLLGR